MNAIPAQDLKRRGIGAVDALLANGPVHVIRNNRPRYVILSEEDYAAMQPQKRASGVAEAAPVSAWDTLLKRPWEGRRTREEIDAQIAEERASWGDD